MLFRSYSFQSVLVYFRSIGIRRTASVPTESLIAGLELRESIHPRSSQRRCLLHLYDDLVTAQAQGHTGLRAGEVHDHAGLVLQPQIADA